MNMIDYYLDDEKVHTSIDENAAFYKPGSKNPDILLSRSNFEFFNKGNCSYIYKSLSEEGVLFKVYNIDVNLNCRLSRSMLDFLKQSDFPNVVKLHDCYYATKSRIFQWLAGLDAYSMSEVVGEKVRFVDYDRKQLIEILECLKSTLEGLSKRKIILRDMHPGNIVLTGNGLTIIDCDQFIPSNFYEGNCYQKNEENTLRCINSIISSEIDCDLSNILIDETDSSLLDSFEKYICSFDENTIGEHLENQKCKK